MFLLDPILTHLTLTWTSQPNPERPLPPHIQRTYVSTPGGPLELLICNPKPQIKSSTATNSSNTNTNTTSTPTTHPPLFFLHGGYGHATIWLEWLTHLYTQNYPSPMYAFSARAHGASYPLPYADQVHKTSFEDILSDAVYCLEHVRQIHKSSASSDPLLLSPSSTRPPILIGHSSGGGVAQALLTGLYKAKKNPVVPSPSSTTTENEDVDRDIDLKVTASALCLVDSIPPTGSLNIYYNWFRHDPFFPLRSLFHLGHPTSPLSTLDLVRSAFFGSKCDLKKVEEFYRWMPKYESMGWPQGMFGTVNSFWEWMGGREESTWLDLGRIAGGIQGVQCGRDGEKETDRDVICVMVGREDMMYRAGMWEGMCRGFREVVAGIRGGPTNENGGTVSIGGDSKETREQSIDKVTVESADGVRLILVDESGHHVQNDAHCEQAAEALLRWVMQV